MSDSKLAEAREHLKEAEKCLKTGLLKWKPDYEGACIEYGKAAIAFKNAKSYNEAIDCYLKQLEAEKAHGSLYQAAKAAESAAMLCKEKGDFIRAGDLVEQASELYLEHGVGDTAAIMLSRGAKMLEQATPEKSIQLYKKACDVAEAQDRMKECTENIGRAARVCIKIKKFDDAAKYIGQELDFMSRTNHGGVLNKLVMGLVLVHLHREDYVAADQSFQKALRQYTGFRDSDEAGPIETFLEAYNDGNGEKAESIARGSLFAYMENEFTKLARDLKYPKSSTTPATTSAKDSSAAAGGGGEEEDKDEYDGGLC
ncbi:hypothetical protein HELRODRAFT_184947 [Helobdella robusta]|uniref:Gamma-soluble NSF attachment protein n=1 Tax=Helobdella robusta TaxID=6412 RepID=T1FM72_HELRO|nr:hypothetical protein HELRODRAFT_184947 [Helobdella robusta]ESO06693.1 hypothetical protein HELRODRAFT_184947 [Helobdella robusta]